MTAPLSFPREVARSESRKAALLHRLLEGSGVDCEVRLASGEVVRSGAGDPKFRVVFHSDAPLAHGLDEVALGRAYVEGAMDIEGDLWSLFELRERLTGRRRRSTALRLLGQLLSSQAPINRRSIAHHYGLGDDFYHSFLDSRYHFYSHGIFHDEAETLEESSEHKLEQIFEGLKLAPGMRLLDIGGGWGGVMRYSTPRGVKVTALTLAEDSHRYISRKIAEEGLTGEVHFQDFLEHRPAEPYDAAVICGVIEHIPTYRRFWSRAWECMKPGGLLYLDASASKEKYDMGTFARRYIWHGTHTYLCLQDLIQEALWHGWEIVRVRQETHDYALTMRHWAERFEACREKIVERWGEALYRIFRIYLWGGCHALYRDQIQAYHVVARRRPDRGPRPSTPRRVRHFLRSLR